MSITAVILCGGQGTRLRSAIGDKPKCLAPVAGKPFLGYVLDRLASQGVEDVILCTRLEQRDCYPFEARYSYDHLSGTAVAVRNTLHLLRSDPVLVLNGDTYVEFNLDNLLHYWRKEAPRLEGPTKVVTVHKHRPTGPREYLGVCLASKEFIQSIPQNEKIDLETVLLRWAGRGHRVYGIDEDYLDIGTPDNYARAEAFLREKGLICG